MVPLAPWHAALGPAGVSALAAASPRLLRLIAAAGAAAPPHRAGPIAAQQLQARRAHKTDAAADGGAAAAGEREDPVTRVRKSIKVRAAAARRKNVRAGGSRPCLSDTCPHAPHAVPWTQLAVAMRGRRPACAPMRRAQP